MSETGSVAQTSLLARWTTDAVTFGLVVAGTAAVWAHTLDEIRIGEMSAIPAGVLNVVLVARWRALGPAWRGWLAILFGLFWTVAAVPYHVLPLLQGVTTWQNVSGLLRIAGGGAMVAAGLLILRERRGQNASLPSGSSARASE